MGLFDFLKKKKPAQGIESSSIINKTDAEIFASFRDDKEYQRDLATIQGTQAQKDILAQIDAAERGEVATVNREVATRPAQPVGYMGNFKLHDDIKKLLWFGDGANKNLTREQMNTDPKTDSFTILGGRIKISVYISMGDEPSLIYTGLPITKPVDESVIPRPPYYPKYKELTPEQRWIYAKLLTDPYNTDIDIGYIFILYYGLERHLLQGDFDSAFKVILKLRDVHKNKSFQTYSGNALVLASMVKGKGEYIPIFLDSLDKEYEFNFYDDVLLMSYYSFNVPLLPKDIMRMAKTFGFTNTNYIKKNPDIFIKCLTEVIREKTNTESLDLKHYIQDDDIPKLKLLKTMIFANTSIVNNTITIPLLSSNPKLNTEIKTMLETTHESVKTHLVEMRKSGKGI